MVGIVLLGVFVLLLAFGAPIAVCLGMSSVGAILVQGAGKPLDAIMSVLPRLCSSASSKFVLLAIPFFITAGAIMNYAGISSRLLDLADGLLVVDTMDGNQLNFSQSFSCPDCGISMEEIEPRSFSFNNPFGACPSCAGLGYKMEFDEDLMIPDKTVSIADGAITVLGWQSCTDKSSYTRAVLDALAEEYDFSLSTPFCEYPKKIHDILIYGTNGKSVKVHYRGQRGVGVYDVAFEGLIKNVERRYRETGSDSTKQEYETFMRVTPCQACHGQRLKPTSLGVTVGDKNIFEVTSFSGVQPCRGFSS